MSAGARSIRFNRNRALAKTPEAASAARLHFMNPDCLNPELIKWTLRV
jgi:hypothetical protein